MSRSGGLERPVGQCEYQDVQRVASNRPNPKKNIGKMRKICFFRFMEPNKIMELMGDLASHLNQQKSTALLGLGDAENQDLWFTTSCFLV